MMSQLTSSVLSLSRLFWFGLRFLLLYLVFNPLSTSFQFPVFCRSAILSRCLLGSNMSNPLLFFFDLLSSIFDPFHLFFDRFSSIFDPSLSSSFFLIFLLPSFLLVLPFFFLNPPPFLFAFLPFF